MSTGKIINLIGKIVCYVLFALGVVFGLLIIVNGVKLQSDVALQDSLVLPSVYITEVAVVIAILVAVIFPLFFMNYTKQGLIKTGILVLGIVALVVIAYLIPDAQLSDDFMNNPDLNVSPAISKWVGTGCYITYFLFVASLITVVYAAISDMLKKR